MDILNGPRTLHLFKYKAVSDPGDPAYKDFDFLETNGGLPFAMSRIENGDLSYTLCRPQYYSIIFLRSSDQALGSVTSWGVFRRDLTGGNLVYREWAITYRSEVPTGGNFKWLDSDPIPYNATAAEFSAACSKDLILQRFTYSGGPLDEAPIFVAVEETYANSVFQDIQTQLQYNFDEQPGLFAHRTGTRIVTADTGGRDPVKLLQNDDKIVALFNTPCSFAICGPTHYEVNKPTTSSLTLHLKLSGQGATASISNGSYLYDTQYQGEFRGVYSPPRLFGTYAINGRIRIEALRVDFPGAGPPLSVANCVFSTRDIPFDAPLSFICEALADAIDGGSIASMAVGGTYFYPLEQTPLIKVDRQSFSCTGTNLKDGINIDFVIKPQNQGINITGQTNPNTVYMFRPISAFSVYMDTRKMRQTNVRVYDKKLNLVADKFIGLGVIDAEIVDGNYKLAVVPENSTQYVKIGTPFTADMIYPRYGVSPNLTQYATVYKSVGYMCCETYEGWATGDSGDPDVRLNENFRPPSSIDPRNDTIFPGYGPGSAIIPNTNPFNVPHSCIFNGNQFGQWFGAATFNTVAYPNTGGNWFGGSEKNLVLFRLAGWSKHTNPIWYDPNLPPEERYIGGKDGDRWYNYSHNQSGGDLKADWSYDINFGPPGDHDNPLTRDTWGYTQHAIYEVAVPNWVIVVPGNPNTDQTAVTGGVYPGMEFRDYDKDFNLIKSIPMQAGAVQYGMPGTYFGTLPNPLDFTLPNTPIAYGRDLSLGYGKQLWKWSDDTISFYETKAVNSSYSGLIRIDKNNNVLSQELASEVSNPSKVQYAYTAKPVAGPDDCLYSIVTLDYNDLYSQAILKTTRDRLQLAKVAVRDIIGHATGYVWSICLDDKYNMYVMSMRNTGSVGLSGLFIAKIDRNFNLVCARSLIETADFNFQYVWTDKFFRLPNNFGNQLGTTRQILNCLWRLEWKDGELIVYGPEFDPTKISATSAFS